MGEAFKNVPLPKEFYTDSKENNLTKPGETPDTVKKETQKNKDNLFESLMGTSLKENKEHAKILTKEALAKVKGNDTLFNKLKTYQTEHLLLPADGRVGPETYAEMKADYIVEKAGKGFEKAGLSLTTLKEINKIIPTLSKSSKNLFVLNNYLARFKTEDKFKTFREKLDFKKELNKTEVIVKKKQTGLESSKEGQNFVSIIKDKNLSTTEKFKKIATDPTMLLVGGLLFLFGVIGGDTKYTDSFFKRIGWIMGGALFGKSLWNKIGIGELEGDVSKIASDIANNVKNAAKKSKPKVTEFFKNYIPEKWSDLKDTDFSKISKNIGEKYDNVTSGFSSYNDTLKDKDGNIKEEPLVVLTGLMSDEKFLNLSKIDLESINDENSLFGVITDETKNKLIKAKVSSKDIKNFIKNHILKDAFGKEKNANLVNELLFTESIKNLYLTFTQNGEYVNDDNINENISKRLSKLTNSLVPQEKNIGKKLSIAIKSGEIEKFNIENYKIEPNIKTEILEIIKKVKESIIAEKEIKDKITSIEKIKPISTKNLQKETLESYIIALDKIILNIDKIKTYDFSSFTDKKSEKRKEILGWAKDNHITELTINGATIIVIDELEKEEKNKKVIEDKKTLENIEIENIPTSEKSPVEFKEWYDKNLESFKTAEKFENNTDPKIKKLAKKILDKKDIFISNYEEIKTKYVTKIGDIKTEIDKIIDLGDYLNNKKIIKKQKNNLETITKEIYIGIKLDDFTDFYKRITGEYVEPKFKNTFIDLDDKLNSKTASPDLNTIASDIREKIIDIEKAFSVSINTNVLDISNPNDINNFLVDFVKKINIVNSFENDNQKNEKIKQLEKTITNVETKYINEINQKNTISELDKIYENYKSSFRNKIKGETISEITSFFTSDSVETAYQEKVNELKIEEFGKKKVVDVFKNNKEFFTPYINFYDNYENYTKIYDDMPGLIQNENLTIKQFLAKLNLYTTLPQSNLTDKESNIISDTRFKGISPAYDGFNKNAKDMIEEIKNNIIK